MALAQFRILNNDFLNKGTYLVPEQAPFITIDRKSDVCMAKNDKDNKHTIHITKIIPFVRNGEDRSLQSFSEIVTKAGW